MRSRKDLLWQDIDYLAAQRSQHPEIRAFLIYATINERPDEFTDSAGASKTPRNRKTRKGSRYRVRRVCRATQRIPSKNKSASGHYAVLIEVAPPKVAARNDVRSPATFHQQGKRKRTREKVDRDDEGKKWVARPTSKSSRRPSKA